MKKLMALLVALCMVLSLLPMTAMAVCDTCVDEDNDASCDVCGGIMDDHVHVHDTWYFDYEDHISLCACWVSITPWESHTDSDADGYCDVCAYHIAHECIDEDTNYYCDYCHIVLEHTCVDEDTDYRCDFCYGILPHECIDEDGDYWCDICWDRMPHDCVDEDGDNWCDICWELMPHDCIDEDGDYWCDICYETLPHDCINEDGDAYCDLCRCELEHDCVDGDNDYWCDLCGRLFEHDCVDADGDYQCDLCGLILEHDCADADGNGRCDICDWLMSDHVHNYDTWEAYSKYEHVQVCICGQRDYTSWGEHLDENADGLCDTCSYDMTAIEVWVGGVQVTLSNASDILGDGTASFDPSTNTLTLSGANIVNGQINLYGDVLGAGIYSNEPLNLVLVGENAITTTDPGTVGMSCGVAAIELNISGSGSLTVNVSGGEMNLALYGMELTIADNLGVTGAEELEMDGVVALVPAGSGSVVVGVPSDPSNPPTGDSTPVVLMFGLMALSAGAILVLGKKAYRV